MTRHYCNQVNDKDIDKIIKVYGWAAKRRDHGGIIFIDFRDHTGILQLVFNPDNKDLFKMAESIRSEYVLCIEGKVSKRLEGAVNKEIPSGSIEIIVSKLEILNKSDNPPFKVNDINNFIVKIKIHSIRSKNFSKFTYPLRLN